MSTAFQEYMKPPTKHLVNGTEPVHPGKDEKPQMVEVDRNDIETKAKIIVANDFNTTFFPQVAADAKARMQDFYVVWKVKALQNWKVLVSTDIISGQYWELTFNGNGKVTYVDHYVKRHNRAVTDEAYAAMS